MQPLSVGCPCKASADPDRAISLLYTHHAAAVRALALRRTGDPMLADDITADTFLQAWQALPRYEERGRPILAWLLRIAAHVTADQRRRSRHGGWGAGWNGTDQERLLRAPAAEAEPAVLLERQERVAWVRGRVATLAPLQRRALALRYGEGYRVTEVAQQLGKSPGATKQLLHRAILTLRTRLQEADGPRPSTAACDRAGGALAPDRRRARSGADDARR